MVFKVTRLITTHTWCCAILKLRNRTCAILQIAYIALVKMSKQIDRFENAQRNFENAQISIMRGTYT